MLPMRPAYSIWIWNVLSVASMPANRTRTDTDQTMLFQFTHRCDPTQPNSNKNSNSILSKKHMRQLAVNTNTLFFLHITFSKFVCPHFTESGRCLYWCSRPAWVVWLLVFQIHCSCLLLNVSATSTYVSIFTNVAFRKHEVRVLRIKPLTRFSSHLKFIYAMYIWRCRQAMVCTIICTIL